MVQVAPYHGFPPLGAPGQLVQRADGDRGLWATTADGQGYWPVTGGVLNAMAYGARNDGSTDTAAALNAAVVAAPVGAHIVFPAGLYRFDTAPAAITKRVSIYGAGVGETFFDLRFNGNFLDFEPVASQNGIVLEGFTVSNASGSNQTSGFAIVLGLVTKSYLRDIRITSALGNKVYSGLLGLPGSQSIYVDNVVIEGCVSTGVELRQDGSVAGTAGRIVDWWFGDHTRVASCGNHGYYLNNTSSTTTADLEGIHWGRGTSEGNTGDGIRVHSNDPAGVTKGLHVLGACLDGNTGDGLGTSGAGRIQILRLQDVWSSNNDNRGIYLSSIVRTFVIQDGFVNLSDNEGIVIDGSKFGTIAGTMVSSNGRVATGTKYGLLLANSARYVTLDRPVLLNDTDSLGTVYQHGCQIESTCLDIQGDVVCDPVSGTGLDILVASTQTARINVRAVVDTDATVQYSSEPPAVYNAYSSNGANYERAALYWSSNTLRLAVQALGTGAARTMAIVNESNAGILFGVNNAFKWSVGTGGTLVPTNSSGTGTDLANAIGAPTQRVSRVSMGGLLVGITTTPKTTAYTATSTDAVITGDTTGGAFAITLPTAVNIAGTAYAIRKTAGGANALTIQTTSAQTINGAAPPKTVTACVILVSDGANWITIAEF